MEIQSTLKEIQVQLLDIRKSEREMERSLDKRFSEISDKIHMVSERLSIDIATLKATAIAYGSIAGLIPGAILMVFDLLKKGN